MKRLAFPMQVYVDGVRRSFRFDQDCELVLPFVHKFLGSAFESERLDLAPSELTANLQLVACVLAPTAAMTVRLHDTGTNYSIAANGLFVMGGSAMPVGAVPIVANTTSTQATIVGLLAYA